MPDLSMDSSIAKCIYQLFKEIIFQPEMARIDRTETCWRR